MSRTENFLAGIFFMLCCIVSILAFAFLEMVRYNGIVWFVIEWGALLSTPVFFFLGLRHGIRGLRQDEDL